MQQVAVLLTRQASRPTVSEVRSESQRAVPLIEQRVLWNTLVARLTGRERTIIGLELFRGRFRWIRSESAVINNADVITFMNGDKINAIQHGK